MAGTPATRVPPACGDAAAVFGDAYTPHGDESRPSITDLRTATTVKKRPPLPPRATRPLRIVEISDPT